MIVTKRSLVVVTVTDCCCFRLNGCYEALSGGLVSEALTDFTGGLTERFNFANELPDNMFDILYRAKRKSSLMGCSIDVSLTCLLCTP